MVAVMAQIQMAGHTHTHTHTHSYSHHFIVIVYVCSSALGCRCDMWDVCVCVYALKRQCAQAD